jgi:hypothetical protein
MKDKFWYFENWNGRRKGFLKLKDAIKSASDETIGNAITIFNKNGVAKIITIDGYCPS